MAFSPKQKKFFKEANKRWNIKCGATRSGKTFMDFFVIPKRIRKCKGDGLIVIIGNSQGTVERNILEPLRNIWGKTLVPENIKQDGSIRLFGKKVYIMGADNKSSAKKMQGGGWEYCYGDEITTWHETVFQMVKSRLDKPNSIFDGTCNPDHPKHWFKKFLDSKADIYLMDFTIDDNPFLSPEFVKNLKLEYEGSVYYDRFILGKWVAAQGIIYRKFADNCERYRVAKKDIDKNRITTINIGVDFGGTKSGTTFVATGIIGDFDKVICLKSKKLNGRANPEDEKSDFELDPETLGKAFVEFVKSVEEDYGLTDTAYCDNAESVLIQGLKKAASNAGLGIRVKNARKIEINQRIRLQIAMLSSDVFGYVAEDCETLEDAMSSALWDDKHPNEDIRLDNGTTDIDTMDAYEYTIEKYRKKIIDSIRGE